MNRNIFEPVMDAGQQVSEVGLSNAVFFLLAGKRNIARGNYDNGSDIYVDVLNRRRHVLQPFRGDVNSLVKVNVTKVKD